jgi:hypothetical protein
MVSLQLDHTLTVCRHAHDMNSLSLNFHNHPASREILFTRFCSKDSLNHVRGDTQRMYHSVTLDRPGSIAVSVTTKFQGIYVASPFKAAEQLSPLKVVTKSC